MGEAATQAGMMCLNHDGPWSTGNRCNELCCRVAKAVPVDTRGRIGPPISTECRRKGDAAVDNHEESKLEANEETKAQSRGKPRTALRATTPQTPVGTCRWTTRRVGAHFWSLAERTLNLTTSSKHRDAAQLQLARVGHVGYVIVLNFIAHIAHSPHADQSVFGNIDFDPNDYANAVLAGEPYPAQPGKSKPMKSAGLSPANEDISVAIGKLNVGLDDVEKQLKSVVSVMCVLRRFPCLDADELLVGHATPRGALGAGRRDDRARGVLDVCERWFERAGRGTGQVSAVLSASAIVSHRAASGCASRFMPHISLCRSMSRNWSGCSRRRKFCVAHPVLSS